MEGMIYRLEIYNYPENTKVYSAHTPCTTLGEEKKILKSERMI